VTRLEVADVVVIAGRVLGIGTDAALGQADLAAARTALAAVPGPPRTWPAGRRTWRPARLARPARARRRAGRDDAAAGAIRLIRALLDHPPFPRHREVVAVASGLQYLSVNGWLADLDPPGPAAVVVEALASGRLEADAAVAWLEPRLAPRRRLVLSPALIRTPARRPRPAAPRRARVAAPVAVVIAASGLTLLASACGNGPMTTSQVSYTACMRSHGVRDFPDPSARGVIVVDASTGISRDSAAVRSAQRSCADDAPPAVQWSSGK
jgi:hypothetical protein